MSEEKVHPRFREKTAITHGTRSGYDYHRRQLKEEPCMACSVAHSEHWRLQRKLKADHINALRRARRAENPQISTAKWFTKHLDEILELYGPNCHICNTPIDLKAPRRVGIAGWERSFHPDHVVPLSKGGQNVIENIRPAHAKCNMRKAATLTGAIQGETTESEVIEPSEPSNP